MLTAVQATRRSLGYFRSVSNYGINSGHQQANVVILPNHLAKDFEEFCRRNLAPLPLLYHSRSGETSCTPLARNADIRTDISQYHVYEEGCLVKTVSSLQSYFAQPSAAGAASQQQPAPQDPWSDMVCFYLGCSFGFEDHLRKAGVPVRNVEQGTNVSMYRTAVRCVPAGVFSCLLVVTMRPVPAAMLDAAVEVTHLNPLAHGAPVHIGDPGQRGIRALFVQDELLLSCLTLSHANSVAITTGFPTHHMQSPPDETDGPPGAIAMATMLLSLGKQVTMVMDRRALEMNQAIIDEAVSTGVLKNAIPIVTFEESSPDSALHFLCHHGDPKKPRYDHLVAIERSGRAEDGNYYNMRGVNVKHLVDPIDNLFLAAKDIPGISTTGIGDGGNELGMGGLRDKVRTMMPNGGLIACDVPADYAITAGVSNWGGYAVACGLYLLHTCPSHQRYRLRGLAAEQTTPQEQLQDWTANLPSVDKEESILSTLVRFGIRSGKTGNLAMEVDGLTFHPTHSDIITRLLDVTLGRNTLNP
ncbi:D-glutamate cyclase, mitochondrial isoform 3-T3 [Spinachia spinachia]